MRNNFPLYLITNLVDSAAHLLVKHNGKQHSDTAIEDKIVDIFSCSLNTPTPPFFLPSIDM